MLLRITIANFFSIKDEVEIDFRAANIHSKQTRELQDNVFEWNGTTVLKTIGLFGPNASGKSNIIKAVNFCCRMVLESHLHNEGAVFNFEPFKFDGCDSKPSKFRIEFVYEGVEYDYGFELTRTAIVRESLYYYPNGRRAKIFTRDENSQPKYTFGEGVMPRPNDVALNTSTKNLFLSRASSMNREIAQRVYRFFLERFMLGMVEGTDKITEDNFTKYKALILKALSICDSDIMNIDLVHETIHTNIPKLENQSITFSPADRDVIRFKTYHRRDASKVFDMQTEESGGTWSLFLILLNLLDVVRHNKSLMLDEFDWSLHSRLSNFIIDLVHASKNAQLLFTSHNTSLIDTKRFRRDQILFVNKKEDASTEVYSLYDYKDFRDNMDAEKAYIQGRFDAVPYIESSVANLKSLLEE